MFKLITVILTVMNRKTGYKHPNSETNSRFLGAQTSYKDVRRYFIHEIHIIIC